MKKGKFLLFFLMLIAVAFIPFKASAASWKFMWKNTTVHVPLGASIEDYKNVPKANLYRNEILFSCENLYVNVYSTSSHNHPNWKQFNVP